MNKAASLALIKVAWRYLLSHPLQSILMLLGITLGVAVAVSVDVANASAERAFELSSEAVSGRATHYISGGPSGLAEELYTQLRLSADVQLEMAPVLSQLVSSPQIAKQSLQLLGVDPFAEASFRNYYGGGTVSLAAESLTAFLARPGAILLSSGTLISPEGATTALAEEDFMVKAQGSWKSPHSGAIYPMGWVLCIPGADLELELFPYLQDQELNLSFSYWEGAAFVRGVQNGAEISGQGYVEMTGYAESLEGQF